MTTITPIMSSNDVPTPILQNVVSTVHLGAQLDLKQISLRAHNTEYNPKRFPAVIMRIQEPKATALIFHNGKMVCTGAKSEQECHLAARRFARIIQKLGFAVGFSEYRVQNMVGSVDMKFKLQLEALYHMQRRFTTYDPEIFPGLVYRMIEVPVVLLVFESGKVVLTGAKENVQIAEAFRLIHPILKSVRK